MCPHIRGSVPYLPRPRCTELLNAPCADGLKERPTRSRGAKRPPTRCRAPWTRRTSPPSGRNPPSTSRTRLAPPGTAGAGSSAPGGESGRTLREGGTGERQRWLKGTHPPLQPPANPDGHSRVAGGSAFFPVEHIVVHFTCSSSRSGAGSVAVHGRGRCFLEPDAPWTTGSSVLLPTVVTFLSLRNHTATGHAPWQRMKLRFSQDFGGFYAIFPTFSLIKKGYASLILRPGFIFG